MTPAPPAKTRIYLSDGSHIDVLEELADFVKIAGTNPPVPTVFNEICPFTYPAGAKVYVNISNVTRVEAIA